MSDKVFLTWNDHRRSKNLAPVLEADYICLESRLPYFVRLLILGTRTTLLLAVRRPKIVFSQNPSLALAALCCLLKPFVRYVLVVDRHSNFKLETLQSSELKMRLFHMLSRWTTKKADVTIVTNENLKMLVDEWGGKGVVLPDRLPFLETDKIWEDDVKEPFVAVFIASYDTDEPLDELLNASRNVTDLFHIYITGDYKRVGLIPPTDQKNITFTGFLSDEKYIALLHRVDLVIVLTSEENLLNCGSYEAVTLGKPMMLSDSVVIREYFCEGAIYVDNTTESIVSGLKKFATEKNDLISGVNQLKKKLERDWQKSFDILQGVIASIMTK